MYRGGFIGRGSVEVFICNRDNPIQFTHLQPHLIFNTNHLSKTNSALCRVWDFDHKSRFPVLPVRYERVVGAQLFLYALWFEHPLDTQHFLNLVANGGGVFEVQTRVLPQSKLSVFLMRHYLSTKIRSSGRIFLEAPEVISRQLCHVGLLEYASAPCLIRWRTQTFIGHRPHVTTSSGALRDLPFPISGQCARRP